jgi:hypothetical protein
MAIPFGGRYVREMVGIYDVAFDLRIIVVIAVVVSAAVYGMVYGHKAQEWLDIPWLPSWVGPIIGICVVVCFAILSQD